jgi:hypothetical protein
MGHCIINFALTLPNLFVLCERVIKCTVKQAGTRVSGATLCFDYKEVKIRRY